VTILPAATAAGDARTSDLDRLKKTAKQLEGVFVQQLFKAMRDTVPKDGIGGGGTGEEMFTSMMDQHFSEALPAQWKHDLSDALVAQLKDRVKTSTAPAKDAPALPRPSAPEIR